MDKSFAYNLTIYIKLGFYELYLQNKNIHASVSPYGTMNASRYDMGGGRNEDEIPNNDEQATIHASHSKS